MASNSETEKPNLDNDRNIDDTELNRGNGMPNDEAKEDFNGYKVKKITELTDDEIRYMEFESVQKAIEFYEMYAKCYGFVVRKDDVERDFNGNIVVRQLVCNREGNKNKKRLDRCKDPRQTTRTNCKARLRVAHNFQSGKWRVSIFEPYHNHELTPAQNDLLIPNSRRMREADKTLVEGLHSNGSRTCYILGFMMGQTEEHRNFGFCKKDLYNFSSQGRARLEGGDTLAALSYLRAKADNDHMFFSKFNTKNDGSLENLFWSDGTSRIDFECFGDVVAFDTTYKNNIYNKPLVIFCGYNHHGETTIFGCALVSDDKKEAYEWVLNAFSEAMFGKYPPAVVTNGDKAMREAIEVVFPNASHRLCSWHLHQNACENVNDPNFLKDFKSLTSANYTPERFETEWKTLMDNYDVSDNKWVKEVYAMKTMWASAYMREFLFCGIRTTSLCEGINSFIKRCVQNKNSLVDFMHNFERALKEYRHNESVSDFESFYSEPVLTSALQEIEHEASKIFTRKKFGEVKNEIEDAAALNVIERSVLDNNVMLKINRFRNPDSELLVCIDKVEGNFLCDCKQFQRVGIPCSHIICAMKHEHMDWFPNGLICKRWTKSSKVDCISTITSNECDTEKLFMLRRGGLSAAINKLCEVSCKHAADYKEAMEGIYNMFEKISKRNDDNGKEKTNSSVVGARERRCSHCKRIGHIKRRCPVLAARHDLYEVSDGDSTCQSEDDSKNINVSVSHDQDDQNDHIDSVSISNGIHEDIGKSCGSKRKRKGVSVNPPTQDSINEETPRVVSKSVSVNPPTQDSINEKTPRDAEKVEFSGPHVNINMSNINIDTRRADASVKKAVPNAAAWNYGSMHGANYFTGWNGVPNYSVPIFPQFRPMGNFLNHSVPHHTPPPFMGALEMEHSAKMARNRNGNDVSKLNP